MLKRRLRPPFAVKGDIASAEVIPDRGARSSAAPIAIARPTTTEETVRLVKWANTNGVAIVPRSSPDGPRGRGDAPCGRSYIIADMSGMARMIHADSDNRIAIVEPGVTFAAFDRALQPYGLRSFKPLMPRSGKSVLASYLEREPITSPSEQWDTSDPLSSLELVFGEGSIFRTGGAAAPGTLEENLERGLRQMVSVGPMATDFTRVFQGAQGSLGIVSWGSAYCERIPTIERASLIASETLAPLAELAQNILWHRMGGQLFIVNRRQMALMCARDAAGYDVLVARLPPWILYLNVAAAPYFAEESMAYLRADAEAHVRALGLDMADALGPIEAARLHGLVQDTRGGDYKARLCGDYEDIFFLSQLDKAERFVDAVERIEPSACCYIQPMVHGVTCHMEFIVPLTPAERAAEPTRSIRIAEACAGRGAFFSRPHAPWGGTAFASDPGAAATIRHIKAILDPNDVMNPDRFSY